MVEGVAAGAEVGAEVVEAEGVVDGAVVGRARPGPSGTQDADVIGPKPRPPRPRNNGRSLESPSRMRNSEDEGRR